MPDRSMTSVLRFQYCGKLAGVPSVLTRLSSLTASGTGFAFLWKGQIFGILHRAAGGERQAAGDDQRKTGRKTEFHERPLHELLVGGNHNTGHRAAGLPG